MNLKYIIKLDTNIKSPLIAKRHWEKFKSIKHIPSRYVSCDMITETINIHKNMYQFSEKDKMFITKDIVNNFYDKYGITEIPIMFINNDIIKKEYSLNGLKNMSSVYITGEMITEDNYLESVKIFEKIPCSCITKEMFYNFWNKHKVITKNIFTDFLTEDIIKEFWQSNKSIKSILIFGSAVKEYMFYELFESVSTFEEKVEIYEFFIKNELFQKNITSYYWDKLKDKHCSTIFFIPLKLITREMVDEHWNMYKEISFIPFGLIKKEYILEFLEFSDKIYIFSDYLLDEEIIEVYLFKCNYNIGVLKPSLLSYNIVKRYFIEKRRVSNIPSVYLTQEFFNDCYITSGNKKAIPLKFRKNLIY